MADLRWVGTWSQGLTDLSGMRRLVRDQTVRAVVRASLGGEQVRIRMSNPFGREPAHVGAAHISTVGLDGALLAASGAALSFDGEPSTIVGPGAEVASDVVRLEMPQLGYVAVDVYFPGAVAVATSGSGQARSFLCKGNGAGASGGRFRELGVAASDRASSLPPIVPLLAGIDAAACADESAVVCFGDSITAGGWPALLAERIASNGRNRLSVLNQGISGNRVLRDGAGQAGRAFGPAGVTRFGRDALGQPGVRYVLFLEGVNDLGHPGDVAPADEEVTAAELIGGIRTCAAQARDRGVRFIAGTILPFGGAGSWTPARERARRDVNDWIRSSAEPEHIFDADLAARDPQRPDRLLPSYDSGDHLHPGPLGLRAIAESVDLAVLDE